MMENLVAFIKSTVIVIAMFIIIGLALFLIWRVGFMPSGNGADVCYGANYAKQLPSQACLDQRFNQCMATEKYSRDQCAAMIGR